MPAVLYVIFTFLAMSGSKSNSKYPATLFLFALLGIMDVLNLTAFDLITVPPRPSFSRSGYRSY